MLAFIRQKVRVLADSRERAADQAFCLRKEEQKKIMDLEENTLAP